ncbi:diguanylate cyclase [Paracoccaceae bacterium Fryx2]|nr:diguanylate cyclase [Paracoccaceae bacterium Fryx2]
MNRTDDEQGRLAALLRYEVLDTGPEEEFDIASELARSIFAVPMAAIVLIDRTRLWFKSRPGLLIAHTPRETSFCAQTIRQMGVMVIEDAANDPRFRNNPFVTGSPGIRCYMGAPLTTPDGYNVGTFCILDTIPRDFSDIDREVMAGLARLTVSHLELRMISNEDVQTGATSRRGFLKVLDDELEKCRRYRLAASLVVFDIDRLGELNAAHGQAAANAVIAAAAKAVRDVLRKGDTLGRTGGGKFAVLLTGAHGEEALQAAERFRSEIATARVAEDPSLSFTASFGVLPMSEAFNSAQDWLAAAQSLVERAKDAGRNRSVMDTRVSAGPATTNRNRMN